MYMNVRMAFGEVECECVGWIKLTRESDMMTGFNEHGNESWFPVLFHESLSTFEEKDCTTRHIKSLLKSFLEAFVGTV